MITLTGEQAARREKTLLLALLLSMWAPLATGAAVLLSHSTTQLADFVRRTVELLALFVSWWVFRRIQRSSDLAPAQKMRLEHVASLSVAVAMLCSAVVMIAVAVGRMGTFEPGGNVRPGLVIAVLGLITNGWFWRRYAGMTRERYSPIIASQDRLYRAKTFVDGCVIVALAAVTIWPAHSATRYVDLLGSAAVAAYLLWSGLRTVREASARIAAAQPAEAVRSCPENADRRPLTADCGFVFIRRGDARGMDICPETPTAETPAALSPR